jgi:hypothetical protein
MVTFAYLHLENIRVLSIWYSEIECFLFAAILIPLKCIREDVKPKKKTRLLKKDQI